MTNLDEALPCCGILEMGPLSFDLLKGHITVWLKEPWDAKMTPPSTLAISFIMKHLKLKSHFWYIAFHGDGLGGGKQLLQGLGLGVTMAKGS